MSKNLKPASVLAFERKLANSDALMYAGKWDERSLVNSWSPLAIKVKNVRGTISNYQKNTNQQDYAKLDARVQDPNPQRIDSCALPFNVDTLCVRFSLRVHGNVHFPSACNDQAYQDALCKVINDYADKHRFQELAVRYATNIANGRFLWRNRIAAESVIVHVRLMEKGHCKKEWTFDAHQYSLNSFQTRDTQLNELAETIRMGLSGKASTLLLVDAFARLGIGQEAFPSQELILDEKGSKKEGKKLYQVHDVAAMHSQKIGNALRTIDTWHAGVDEVGPIAVEPFGAVTNRGKAYRQPSKKDDFYNLMQKWVCKGQDLDVDQQHFVIATLIRGGVFGEKAE